MTALDPGSTAPEFSLPGDDGRRYELKSALAGKGAVLFFFKTECPTCQLTVPFVERLYRRLKGSAIGFVAIGQDEKPDVDAFRARFKLTFPVAMEGEPWPASNPYGITNVPTFFLVGKDGKILRNHIGHSKEALEKLLQEAAALGGLPDTSPLFTAADASVKALQPG